MNYDKLFAPTILTLAFSANITLAAAQTESINTVAGPLTITPVNKVDEIYLNGRPVHNQKGVNSGGSEGEGFSPNVVSTARNTAFLVENLYTSWIMFQIDIPGVVNKDGLVSFYKHTEESPSWSCPKVIDVNGKMGFYFGSIMKNGNFESLMYYSGNWIKTKTLMRYSANRLGSACKDSYKYYHYIRSGKVRDDGKVITVFADEMLNRFGWSPSKLSLLSHISGLTYMYFSSHYCVRVNRCAGLGKECKTHF